MGLSTEDNVGLAGEVRTAVAAVDSSLLDEARLRERLTGEMATFISDMRAEVGRVGPFGAQIGEQAHATFFFAEPISGTARFFEGDSGRPALTYVVATTEGFIGLQMSDNKDHNELTTKLQRAIGSAKRGMVEHVGQGIPGYWHHSNGGRNIGIPTGDGYTTRFGETSGSILVDVTGEQVKQAQAASLAKAQQPLIAASASAETNLGIAQDVRSRLPE